jgi:hypothetical protein
MTILTFPTPSLNDMSGRFQNASKELLSVLSALEVTRTPNCRGFYSDRASHAITRLRGHLDEIEKELSQPKGGA